MKAIIACILAMALLLCSSCATPENPPEAPPDSSSSMENNEESPESPEDETPTPPEDETPAPPKDETPTPPEDETPAITPPVSPTPDASEMIGSLYTRGELMALSNTMQACYTDLSQKGNNRPASGVYLQGLYGKYDAHFIGPDDNKFYITFDCGYEHENLTAKILDILKSKQVHCVFFVDSYFARSNPTLIRRIIDEGHILGNHGARHKAMTDFSVDEMAKNITDLHNYVLQNYGYSMTYFRPPSGYYSERVLAVAQSLGYTTVNYNFAYVDWETNNQPNPENAYNHIMRYAHSGGIYLLHAVSATNASILGRVIDSLREKGYEPSLFIP